MCPDLFSEDAPLRFDSGNRPTSLCSLSRLQKSVFLRFKKAREVNQKVWNEAENIELYWGETLKIRTVGFFLSPRTPYGRVRLVHFWRLLYRFLYWFWEKNRLFCSLRFEWYLTGGSTANTSYITKTSTKQTAQFSTAERRRRAVRFTRFVDIQINVWLGAFI